LSGWRDAPEKEGARMIDGTVVVSCIFVWFVFRWIKDDEAREWARTAVIAVAVCWLIVRAGLFSS
jgi:hypothetical protein